MLYWQQKVYQRPKICWYLVGVEYFAGERIVFQGAGGAGAAVVQNFTTVFHLLLILSLQICCSLQKQRQRKTLRDIVLEVEIAQNIQLKQILKKIRWYYRYHLHCKKAQYSQSILIRCMYGCICVLWLLQRVKDHGYLDCSSARSPAPPSPGSWRSSATFQQRHQPASASPDGPLLSLSPSASAK